MLSRLVIKMNKYDQVTPSNKDKLNVWVQTYVDKVRYMEAGRQFAPEINDTCIERICFMFLNQNGVFCTDDVPCQTGIYV